MIHSAKEVYTFKAGHLARRRGAAAAEAQRVRAAEAAEAKRVREEIAGELESLDSSDFEDLHDILTETSSETEPRDSEELAEAINALPGEEYPKLREHCRCASGIELAVPADDPMAGQADGERRRDFRPARPGRRPAGFARFGR